MSNWGTVTETAPDELIEAGEFFPAISTVEFRRDYRIPSELSPELIRRLLELAVIRVRSSLKPYRARMTAAGYGSLSELPQEDNEKTLLWIRAVSCEAKAEILRETVTVDRREPAENAAKSASDTESEFRKLAALAIRELSGRGTMSAEIM